MSEKDKAAANEAAEDAATLKAKCEAFAAEKALAAKQAAAELSPEIPATRESSWPSLADPSVLFLLACVLCPPLVELYEGTYSHEALLEYVLHPLPLLSLMVTALLLLWAHRGEPEVAAGERAVAAWYLVNGVGFKSIMDTMSGSMQAWSLMTKQYNALEPRYARPYYDDPSAQPVHFCSLLEITVMTPLCLWLYVLIVRSPKSATRFCIEFCLATLQATGTWFFYMPNLLTSHSQDVLKFFSSNNFMDLYLRGVFGLSLIHI
eukprot:TRINITY_DN37238_c0_g1_i2.p1 TRINITY_DN37238_c0_g1~~TRINITY_DN37238_c0_g1_i2.p1  ORF type:complete len:263 (+),score=65.30 TRINITY_DN37238_c0_g1_i2:197-985(+)